MKTVVILVLVAVIGFLVYTRPSFNDHQEAILAVAGIDESIILDSGWSDLDYSNFFVASTTKDTARMTMVSYGFLGRVVITDSKWQPKVSGHEY